MCTYYPLLRDQIGWCSSWKHVGSQQQKPRILFCSCFGAGSHWKGRVSMTTFTGLAPVFCHGRFRLSAPHTAHSVRPLLPPVHSAAAAMRHKASRRPHHMPRRGVRRRGSRTNGGTPSVFCVETRHEDGRRAFDERLCTKLGQILKVSSTSIIMRPTVMVSFSDSDGISEPRHAFAGLRSKRWLRGCSRNSAR